MNSNCSHQITLEPQPAASQHTTNHAWEFKTQKGHDPGIEQERGKRQRDGLSTNNNAKVHPGTGDRHGRIWGGSLPCWTLPPDRYPTKRPSTAPRV